MRTILKTLLTGASALAVAAAAPAIAQDATATTDAPAMTAPAPVLPEVSLRPDPGFAADEQAAGFSDEARALEGEEAREVIARASDWLNGVTGMTGRFQQIANDGGLLEGDFYILRPGKLRFDYDAPVPVSIVADGRTVAEIDTDLDTVNRTLLEETPLNWLLKSNVNLGRDATVRGVSKQDGLALISIDDPADQMPGQLVLIFSDPEFALREWVAIDEFGQQTRVILYDVQRQASLDADLFTYELNSGPRRPGGR